MAAAAGFAALSAKYSLHPETCNFYKLYSESKQTSYRDMSLDEARALATQISVAMSGEVDYKGDEFEVIVPCSHNPKGIPTTVYKPSTCPKVPLILIFFHGGGMVLCNRKTHEVMCKILAKQNNAIVVNVEFTLLPNPGNPLAPFDDADTVAKYVYANKEKFGGNPNSKVGACGDSSGGQLAISITMVVPQLACLALIYPFCTAEPSQDKEFYFVPGMDGDTLNFLLDNGARTIKDGAKNPRVNPMIRTDLSKFPKNVLVILAQFDMLNASGKEFCDKLRAAGINVQVEVLAGAPHACVALRKVFQKNSDLAYSHIEKFLKKI